MNFDLGSISREKMFRQFNSKAKIPEHKVELESLMVGLPRFVEPRRYDETAIGSEGCSCAAFLTGYFTYFYSQHCQISPLRRPRKWKMPPFNMHTKLTKESNLNWRFNDL